MVKRVINILSIENIQYQICKSLGIKINIAVFFCAVLTSQQLSKLMTDILKLYFVLTGLPKSSRYRLRIRLLNIWQNSLAINLPRLAVIKRTILKNEAIKISWVFTIYNFFYVLCFSSNSTQYIMCFCKQIRMRGWKNVTLDVRSLCGKFLY